MAVASAAAAGVSMGGGEGAEDMKSATARIVEAAGGMMTDTASATATATASAGAAGCAASGSGGDEDED